MKRRNFITLAACWLVLAGCPGPDFAPVYFDSGESQGPSPAAPSISDAPEAASCMMQFHAELCIALKSESVSLGNVSEGEDALCAPIDQPIPLAISDHTVTMRGDLFPDIIADGHGLPFPVTINGRGDGEGADNIGTGTITADGDINIGEFDLYVQGVDEVGRIPDLHWTTGSAAAIRHMTAFQGYPIDSQGQLALVTSTRLSTLFPSTEDALRDAGLMMRLSGTVDPLLEDCGSLSGQPQSWLVHKLVTNEDGDTVPIAIPGGNQLEISTGTYIASAPEHIGPRYEQEARFRFQNVSERELSVRMPPRLPVDGSFILETPGSLNQTIPPEGSMVVHIHFKPRKAKDMAAGRIEATLELGSDIFTLVGQALDDSAALQVDHIDARGALIRSQAERVHLGDLTVIAQSQQSYFTCALQPCGAAQQPRDCGVCDNPARPECMLLSVDTAGLPVDEVDAQCQLLRPEAQVAQQIDFGSLGDSDAAPQSQIVRLRNMGTQPLTIDALALSPTEHSTAADFIFTPQTVLLTQHAEGLAAARSHDLPITLLPYDGEHAAHQAYVVLGYAPQDLRGADGRFAGVGAVVTDRAELNIDTSLGTQRIGLSGSTSLKDIPPLQVHFATNTGTKDRADGHAFAFRGITQDTNELSVPMFASANAGAENAVRITAFRIEGPDADAFEFLDAAEEIAARPEETRCRIPLFDDTGAVTDTQEANDPQSLAPAGFALPQDDRQIFFGCVSFVKPSDRTQRDFRATLIVRTQQLGSDNQPLRNPDGSVRESQFTVPLIAVVDPIEGPLVFRVSQTMSAIMNDNFPTIAAVPAGIEVDALVAAGKASEADRFMFLGALIADPFDEATITNEHGEIVSIADDGITGVFRPIDTRPSDQTYSKPGLGNYANLLYDATRPEGQRGIFFDFPNLPEDFQTGSLRIFTASLSYPGPTTKNPEDIPEQPSMCEIVNPCSAAGQRKFGDGPTEPGKVGVCTYFFTSAGAYDSPTMHRPEDTPGGTKQDLCVDPNTPQQLYDITGTFGLDGSLAFDTGLRFWGPTYFHNPNGPLGPKPVLDEVWHFNLTTNVLAPPSSPDEVNLLPSERISISQEEYKIDLDNPLLCSGNTDNQRFGNADYSSWKYFAPLMSKDPEGRVPARCGDGGKAYFHGRPYDPETGIMTVVAMAKFSSNDDLTFAFTDVPIFVVMNGWLCDPAGDPERFEGERCYELQHNERDRTSHISIMEDTP